ncbi:Uncharacterized membrane protein YsdA, DUF1294 family [Anaerosporobacter mobilis DSM 15930]|jgi:uncharacterized membrane protein YsdA (DUF1294 family)|uniref:Uncharacterized membrane protein YsdA, DUF1294 family n=1 Tax=Anaerosporobacter mobilis DSM 15930 TaxID=1120996 RepID=A0A1M7LKR5_9FIRM|nr:DUF1294 domain-containing protein [Anaerosporobacter mobilis]SHM78729.1 Uncharacterized membrane protein YsdA, DUF1294 family [Anaerosporobacter mobilis DSM 15930]
MTFLENISKNNILIILIYLVVMNIIGFAIMGIDKSKAKRGAWRIPEKTLFLIAILGGSIGSLLGMKQFRHKTKHKTFTIGMPAILIVQAAIILYCTIGI